MNHPVRKPTWRERLWGIESVRVRDGRVTGWTTRGVGPVRYHILRTLGLWPSSRSFIARRPPSEKKTIALIVAAIAVLLVFARFVNRIWTLI